MKMLTRVLMVLGLLAVIVSGSWAADASDYLTKDGMLKERLEIKDVQGGFAGFTGKAYIIEPNGEWKTARAFNEKLDMEVKGTLTKEQLATLAKEFAKYELAGLEGKDLDKGANPHVVTIKWGKKEAKLTLGAGSDNPKPDNASVPGRFGGIVEAVKAVTKAPEK